MARMTSPGPHRLLTHSLTSNDVDARCQYGWTQRNLVTELTHRALIRTSSAGPPGPSDELFSELVARQAESMGGSEPHGKVSQLQITPDQTTWWLFWVKGVLRQTVEEQWP
jgi:hypothetical protein